MFSFFKRKKNLVTDIGWLGVDIHSHILPGIDDGAKDISESTLYIKELQDLGFMKLFFTPHIFTELYPNNPETIGAAFNIVKDIPKKEFINIELGIAAEHMVDYDFKVTDNLVCLPDRYLLIEMSYLSETPNIEQVIFDLQIKGYKVILAHPERYNFYHKAFEKYHRLKAMGCFFQLNLLSTVGYYGKNVKIVCESLLKHGLYDFAGTDLHHEKHLSILKKTVRSGEMFKLVGNYEFKNLEVFG